MQCVICKRPIAKYSIKGAKGYDASPVAEGLCCGDCHWNHVSPARMRKHRRTIKGIRQMWKN